MYITGKRANSFRLRYLYGEGDNIYSIYTRPSQAKLQAFEECRKKVCKSRRL